MKADNSEVNGESTQLMIVLCLTQQEMKIYDMSIDL